MKSRAHRSAAARLAGTLSATAIAVWCLAGTAAAAPAAGAFPAGGDGFSISLATNSSYSYAGAELAVCGFGTTCSATISQSTPGTQDFEAFVGDDVPGEGHPGFVLVSSNVVPVTWWEFIRLGPAP